MLSGRREPALHFFWVKILKLCKHWGKFEVTGKNQAIVAYLSEKGIKHIMLKEDISSEGDHSVEMFPVHTGEKVGGVQWSLECFLWSLVPVGAPQLTGPGEVLAWLVKPRLCLLLRHPLKTQQNPVKGLKCCKQTCRASEHLPRYPGMCMQHRRRACPPPTYTIALHLK